MPFEIIYSSPSPRLITLGQADQILAPESKAAAMPIPIVVQPAPAVLKKEVSDPPPAIELPEKNKRGRPKKMAKEDFERAGVKTIREDEPGDQGAIGSHGANAPAQEKVQAKPQGAENEKEKSSHA